MERTGLEPAAVCMQSRCASSCATSPGAGRGHHPTPAWRLTAPHTATIRTGNGPDVVDSLPAHLAGSARGSGAPLIAETWSSRCCRPSVIGGREQARAHRPSGRSGGRTHTPLRASCFQDSGRRLSAGPSKVPPRRGSAPTRPETVWVLVPIQRSLHTVVPVHGPQSCAQSVRHRRFLVRAYTPERTRRGGRTLTPEGTGF